MKTNKRWGHGARVDDLDTGKKILLKAAIQCFNNKGVRATTIEDIARTANVTRRTVYRYFAGKPDILDALLHIERERLFRHLNQLTEIYPNDFPRLLEECIWFAATSRRPQMDSEDHLDDDSSEDSLPYVNDEECEAQWRELLAEPLQRHNARHDIHIDIHHLVPIVGRLALIYRQYPTEKREFFSAMRALHLCGKQ